MSKQDRALKYFKRLKPDDKENTKFICEVEKNGKKCDSFLDGRYPYNLVLHLKKQHEEIFAKISSSSAQNEGMDASLQVKRLKLIQNLTDIVTVNGRPFAHLSDSGVVGLMGTDLKVLENGGYAAGLNAPTYPAVRNHINYLASKIIAKITSEVKGKFVSILTDIGTKNRRDLLGVALQYISNGRVIIRSIGMIQLTKSHTGELIKTEILKCLEVFGLTSNQVISFTTDNGSNMIAAVKKINKEIDASNENERDIDTDADADDLPTSNVVLSERDLEIEVNEVLEEYHSVPTDESDITVDPQIFEMLDETSHYLELLSELENEFATQTLKSNGIRCAAHVLQLAVKDALKTQSILTLIKICRTVCKLLRSKKYIYKLEKNNIAFKLPRLDCITRWSSTYRMVTIISLKVSA